MELGFLSLSILAAIGTIGWLVATDVPHAYVESFSMPRLAADRGWTERIVTTRIEERFAELIERAAAQLPPVELRSPRERTPAEKLADSLNVTPLVRIAQQAVGHRIFTLTGAGFAEGEQITLEIVARTGRAPPVRVEVAGELRDMEGLVRRLAADTFRVVNPYLALMVDYRASLAHGVAADHLLREAAPHARAGATHAERPYFANLMGVLHAEAGELDAAAEDFRLAGALLPQVCVPKLNEAEVQLRAGRPAEARRALAGCETSAPYALSRAVGWGLRAGIALAEGDVPGARSAVAAGLAERVFDVEMHARAAAIAAASCDAAAYQAARAAALAEPAPRGMPPEFLAAVPYLKGGAAARLAELGLPETMPPCRRPRELALDRGPLPR
jgi:hypothetical protein